MGAADFRVGGRIFATLAHELPVRLTREGFSTM
jgi:hypothetical protein